MEEKILLVSVLMTAYNREKYISEAIESVLTSTFCDFELIIVDDCSTDNTVNIARQYEKKDRRVQVYCNKENLGDYPNRNRAASYAKGKYLKYLDSDDVLYKNALSIFVETMEQNENCAFALSLENYNIHNKPYHVMNTTDTLYDFFKYRGIFSCGPSGSIIRKEMFDKVGGFSGKQFISDLELWLKLSEIAPLLILQGNLVFWRVHDQQQMAEGIINDEQFVLTIKITNKYLFSRHIPLSFKKRLSSAYSVYRFMFIKFCMLSKARGTGYALNVYKRIAFKATSS